MSSHSLMGFDYWNNLEGLLTEIKAKLARIAPNMSEAERESQAYQTAVKQLEKMEAEQGQRRISMRLQDASEEVDINQHISNKVAKDILGVLGTPLGSGEELPEQKDLSRFWKAAERALQGLNDKVDLRQINRRGCKLLAPIILGEACAAAIEDDSFNTWHEMKLVVENRFGLSEDQLQQ